MCLSFGCGANLTQKLDNIGGANYAVSWGYDGLGRPTSMTYPNGLVLTYQYDSYGRLARILSNAWGTVIDNLLYQAGTGSPYAWKWGNGVMRGITVDTDGRLTKLESSGVQRLNFDYTSNDLVFHINDDYNSGLNSTHGWDGMGRLKTVSRNNGDNQSINYDDAGNRTSSSRAGASSGYQYTASGRDWMTQFAGRNYGWDATGQMTSDGIRSYGWDSFGRMNSAAGVSYNYNAINQRVKKSGGAGTNDFMYGPGGELLYESQTGTAYVWLGGAPVAMLRGGQMYAIHTDQVGRPETVTDGGRTVQWRAQNAAFDRTVMTDNIGGLSLGFAGQYYDAETGLWQNWHRYYDPALARYVSSDPIGLNGGINTYAYVGGNPVSRVDPLGLRDVLVAIWTSRFLDGSVGHVWMGEADGSTITSQFPTPHGIEGANTTKSWLDTLVAEGRAPDSVYRVSVPDDAAFDASAASSRAAARWFALPNGTTSTNCLSAANSALRAGGVRGLSSGSLLPNHMNSALLMASWFGSQVVRLYP